MLDKLETRNWTLHIQVESRVEVIATAFVAVLKENARCKLIDPTIMHTPYPGSIEST